MKQANDQQPGDIWHRLARVIMRYRVALICIDVAVTAGFAYAMFDMTFATRFVDFFPKDHPNTRLNEEYAEFGGAQVLTIMLTVKRGDIFRHPVLLAIQNLTFDVDRLTGVNHHEIFSLGSERIVYTIEVAGGLVSKPYMFPNVPTEETEIAALRDRVLGDPNLLGQFVSRDLTSALIVATFSPFDLDYATLFQQIRTLRKQYRSRDWDLHVAGEPIVRGSGYYYLPAILILCAASLVLMGFVLFLCVRTIPAWWVPHRFALLSAVWGLGFAAVLGFNFDPLIIVVPFLLTARNVSHATQWIDRYRFEYLKIANAGDDA